MMTYKELADDLEWFLLRYFDMMTQIHRIRADLREVLDDRG